MNRRSRYIVIVALALTLFNPRSAGSEPPAKTLKVAVVSSQSIFGNVSTNLSHFETLIDEASSQGARLICFPELALVGYATHPDLLKNAEPIPGPATERLAQIARQRNVYISCGMAERDGDRHYIAQILVGPEGYLGRYRKCFPTPAERVCGFSPGQEYPTWDIDGFRFGIVICFDGRQEETVRAMTAAGVDVVHHPHGNYVGQGRDAEEWTRGKMVYIAPRAIAARAYMLVNNSAGEMIEPGATLHFSSGALVIDALGQAVARTTQHDRKERMVVVTLQHPLSLIPDDELKILAQSDVALRTRIDRYMINR